MAVMATPALEAPTAAAAARAVRKSIAVVFPVDGAYVTSSSIAVAGTAFNRPHGPRIRSVLVELYIAGRVAGRMDLEVVSSRFAGVLQLSTPTGRTDAELLVSDPARSTRPIAVKHLTIDARSSGSGSAR
jgi:hypothetical protein